ncbi:glycosyltransferase [Kaistella polysaccharea]|uniref:glycosyltransferase n=1 Tax=Kaistella polysaccharea TaxID=2878534 RepID=UPI001CF27FA6|nr:glycosyltransferase [Kaistella polysaccharea]
MHTDYQTKLFSNAPMLPSTKVTIVIPVKDEETYIEDLLKSLKDQVDLAGNKINYDLYEVLVLANNCSDGTVDLIKKFKLKNKKINLHLEEVALEAEQANIGFVRKTLMDVAYTRLSINCSGLILTTDGDTIVSQDWIAQNSAEIRNGAEAVGGRILLKEEEFQCLDNGIVFFHQKDEEYQLLVAEVEAEVLENFDHRKGCHHQHFNGSFAVTSECYHKSGGIPVVKHLEDCAFYDRLLAVDAKVRHSNNVIVKTSARCIGRTDIGLSHQLNIWKNIDNQKDQFLVESSESILYRLKIKKHLKDLWHLRNSENIVVEHELKTFDNQIKFDENLLANFTTSNYFGEWFQEIKHLNEHTWREQFQPVDIDEAITNLKATLQNKFFKIFARHQSGTDLFWF